MVVFLSAVPVGREWSAVSNQGFLEYAGSLEWRETVYICKFIKQGATYLYVGRVYYYGYMI